MEHPRAGLLETSGQWHGPNTRTMNKRPKGAQGWIRPLLKDLEQDRGHKVIAELEAVAKGKRGTMRETVDKEINYFGSNLHRMKYKQGHKLGEPLGSGAIESTCRQYQCRFKRPGEFWTRQGDEALMCLETFWRKWTLAHPLSSLTLEPISKLRYAR